MKRLLPALLALVVVAVAVVSVNGCSEDGEAARPSAQKVAKKPNVVVLLFDEFTIDSILNPSGQVDATRFPNFAELAGSSTWFRNATSYYDSTPKAIPLMLDGKEPFKGQAADVRDHPRSIYTAFGRRGYRIVDSEEATAICPRRYCRNARRRRPGILAHLNRGRPERFSKWVGSIRRGKPSLYVKHALFPHGPWMFLPSGKQTRPSVKDPVPGLASPVGFHDRGVTNYNQARYLLQLGYTDRLLGKLLDKLKRTGTYDNTLILVGADHGYSWDVGVADRRRFRQRSIDEVAPVPFFIKAPGQKRGRVSGAYLRTLDALPTLADVLNVRLGYKPDGRSGFSRATRRRRAVRVPDRGFTKRIKISARRLERLRRGHRRRWARVFGTGFSSVAAYGDPWAALYRVGPNRELVGRPLAGLSVGRRGRARARITDAGLTRRVRRRSILLPTQIGGRITGARRGVKRNVAVSVNGRIESVGRTFYLKGGQGESFAMSVPESSLREGGNDVRVFQVSGRGSSLRLTPLGSN